jgi:hypothetical protein
MVRAYVDDVVITSGGDEIARHRRSYEAADFVFDTVERAIRPIALGRKNHLFAGSDGGAERWAVIASLLETAKLDGVEPYVYLTDVLERMTNGHPINRISRTSPSASTARQRYTRRRRSRQTSRPGAIGRRLSVASTAGVWHMPFQNERPSAG